MKCGNCGAENLDTMAYCTVCGTALTVAEMPAPVGQISPDPSMQPAPPAYAPAPAPYGAPAAPQPYPDPGAAPGYPPAPAPYGAPPAPTVACSNCGKPFGPGEMNCTNCGAPVSMGRPMAPAAAPAKKKSPIGLIVGISVGVVVLIGVLLVVLLVVMPKNNYNKAMELYDSKSYVEALAAFEKMGDYEDSEKYAKLCQQHIDYDKALKLLEDENYEEAYKIFTDLGDFEDAPQKAKECQLYVKYNEAVELYNQGKYEAAYNAFKGLGDFKDSRDRMNDCLQPEPSTGLFDQGPGYAPSNDGTAIAFKNSGNSPFIIKVYTMSESYWGAIWVSAYNNTSALPMAPGVYYFTIIRGDNWFGPVDMFGSGSEEKSLTVDGDKYFEMEPGDSWIITVG